MIGTADVHKAIMACWNASDLDSLFKALWSAEEDPDSTPVLHDQNAGPKPIFPYCVYELGMARVLKRQSSLGLNNLGNVVKRHYTSYPLTLNIHVDKVFGDSRSQKEVCADLLEQVAAVFGGHPSIGSSLTELDHGQFIGYWYEASHMVRTELYKYQGILKYSVYVDVPVAV